MSEQVGPESGLRTLLLTDADVAAVADWKAAVSILRQAYTANVDPQALPPRSMARVPGAWLRSLTAVSPLGGYLGCKLIAASPRRHRAAYLVSLFDQETMNLDALIDGNRITGIRTAATAAVALDKMAPSRPLSVAVLGSGFEARAQLTALAAVRRLARADVFSPTPAKREAFAAHFGPLLGVPVKPAATARDAVRGADVVICAARSRDETPILSAAWLEPGATVTSIGSTLPEQREVDVDVIGRAHLIAADAPEEVARDTGDMIAAARAGIDFSSRLVSLGDVMVRRRALRASPEDMVLYKSVGSALQDVVIAEMLLARARERGIGTVLPASISPVAK